MSIESMLNKRLNDVCVYWEPGKPDGFGGLIFTDPREVPCRWLGRKRVELTVNGESHTTVTSVIITDKEVEAGGFMRLGKIDDLPVGISPPQDPDSHEILTFHDYPDLRGKTNYLEAYLYDNGSQS